MLSAFENLPGDKHCMEIIDVQSTHRLEGEAFNLVYRKAPIHNTPETVTHTHNKTPRDI